MAGEKPRYTKKTGLPEKLCRTCGRPFAYRHKWKKDWDQVLYCSERCRRHRPSSEPSPPSE